MSRPRAVSRIWSASSVTRSARRVQVLAPLRMLAEGVGDGGQPAQRPDAGRVAAGGVDAAQSSTAAGSAASSERAFGDGLGEGSAGSCQRRASRARWRRSTGQRLAFGELRVHRVGDGVESAIAVAPAMGFGRGAERVVVHVGGRGQPALSGIVVASRAAVVAETCAPSRARIVVRTSTAVSGWVAFGARMRCGSSSAVER